jgi:hypothetical protein
MDNLPPSVTRAYQELAGASKYQHFVRIPDRIIQCIDYFGIDCDRDLAKARLYAYYLFIGVVDDAIDSGRIDAGRLILRFLSKPAPMFDEVAIGSSVRLMTEILKSHMSDKTYPMMMEKLRELYSEVVSERNAASIDSYIGHRKSVGSLTAELSCVLIRPNLVGEHDALLQFMKEVGAIGCLVDSLIDLSNDRRLGLLSFEPGLMGYAKLTACIVRDGSRVSLKHPGLIPLFVQAVIDNILDRFRAERDRPPQSFPSDRKDEAASVA